MTIVRKREYTQSIKNILTYISRDSRQRAFDFKSALDLKIDDLTYMPFKFKRSIYFDDENIRDLIFKGYVIVYKVDEAKQTMIIIGINKYQEDL